MTRCVYIIVSSDWHDFQGIEDIAYENELRAMELERLDPGMDYRVKKLKLEDI